MKHGTEQAGAASKRFDVKMLQPDFNLKVPHPVATLSGVETLRLTGISVANRPLRSLRILRRTLVS